MNVLKIYMKNEIRLKLSMSMFFLVLWYFICNKSDDMNNGEDAVYIVISQNVPLSV